MIYWASTKSPQTISRPIDQAVVEYLRENQGIDSARLAVDLKLRRSVIESYQRRLGLRKCAKTGRKRLGKRVTGD